MIGNNSLQPESRLNRQACAGASTTLRVRDYDLAATLTSGQAFRWESRDGAWEGVVRGHWVRLRAEPGRIIAETAAPVTNWDWLAEYLQIHVDLDAVLAALPADEPLRAAVAGSRGLRLLRQDPWECLASFILSSTKQIIQIQQIVARLALQFGRAVIVPNGHAPAYAFPPPERLARCEEAELRACKMGFRARYLRATAQRVAAGAIDLAGLDTLSLEDARAKLMDLPGVGGKIADCVLLFACGFPEAFPVDVWVMRALQQLYFPRRHLAPRQLRHFTASHFGPYAGYAQQYLFHFMRTRSRKRPPVANGESRIELLAPCHPGAGPPKQRSRGHP